MTLGAPIDWQLPNETRAIHEAQARGVPIVLDPNRTKVQAVFADMARSLQPFPDAPGEGGARRGIFSSLFRRRPALPAARLA